MHVLAQNAAFTEFSTNTFGTYLRWRARFLLISSASLAPEVRFGFPLVRSWPMGMRRSFFFAFRRRIASTGAKHAEQHGEGAIRTTRARSSLLLPDGVQPLASSSFRNRFDKKYASNSHFHSYSSSIRNFDWVSNGFDWVSLGSTRFCWVFMDFTWCYGSTRISTRFH